MSDGKDTKAPGTRPPGTSSASVPFASVFRKAPRVTDVLSPVPTQPRDATISSQPPPVAAADAAPPIDVATAETAPSIDRFPPVPRPTAGLTLQGQGTAFEMPGYKLLCVLGKGGMGEVHLAERMSDVGVSMRCVVKTILEASAADPRFRQLFLDEVRLVSLLRHPNLVTVMDAGYANGRLYQVIEWIEGLDAAGLVRKAAATGEGVPLKHLLYVMRETLQGLHHAHIATDNWGQPMGIVHRDISPGNILISRQGAVKLADFGVAVGSSNTTEGSAESLAGKPHYFAPELWNGARASVQTDIYAMGVTFYEMLSLRPLFSRNKTMHALAWEIVQFDPMTLVQNDLTLPEGIETILVRSLAANPKERYATALEFLEDVNDYAYENGVRLLDAHFARYMERLLGEESADGRKHLFRG